MKTSRTKIMLFVFIVIAFLGYFYIFVFDRNTSDGKTVVIDNSANAENYDFEENDQMKLYDTKPISDAYLSGDATALDEFELEILNIAKEVLEQHIGENMTDYEKEIAIHDYIALNTEYDDTSLSVLGKHNENAENPYGTLINHRSICSGYTTTFQLFMDMLEIPCKSILATDFVGEEHAWNMVEIQGDWYYVDVTWDDSTPDYRNRPVRHKYFNVTEDYMKKKHEWDSSSLPKADSEENSYISHNLTKLSSVEDALDYMENSLENMNDSVYFSFDEKLGIVFDEEDSIDDYYEISKYVPEFEKVFDEFLEKHSNYKIQTQRVKHKDSYVLAVYMIKISERG